MGRLGLKIFAGMSKEEYVQLIGSKVLIKNILIFGNIYLKKYEKKRVFGFWYLVLLSVKTCKALLQLTYCFLEIILKLLQNLFSQIHKSVFICNYHC